MQAAVERKAKKKYEKDTALIVAVDDSVAFREEDDVKELEYMVAKILLPLLKETNFSHLAFEGSNGLHLCYQIK